MDSSMTSIAMLTDTMVTDSPTPSLRSGLTTTTDGDSLMSTASVPCCHFLSANVINIGECFVAEVTSCPPGLLGVIGRNGPQPPDHKGCVVLGCGPSPPLLVLINLVPPWSRKVRPAIVVRKCQRRRSALMPAK
ncbi:unnamed protein product [Gadus morhua 'NCC']